jgi:FdhE protein
MNTEAHILEIGQIEAPVGEIRFLRPSDRNVFSRRAERFRQLSCGHSMRDYLDFLALLADAQHNALTWLPERPLPDANEQALCRQHGMPLLSARSWRRNPAWRGALSMILQQMGNTALPPAAGETVTGLQQASEEVLEREADRILAGELTEVSPRELPFVAAALQVYWVQMASALGENAFGRLEQGGICPVCGSYPNVGIVSAGGTEQQGLRYLCCSLCTSQWHMVRIKCSSCESSRGINHYILEGSNGAVKAESCDDCNAYLKLLYLDKDRQMEAMADDLATLALDMLMDSAGKFRGGPNLFFHPGGPL